MQMEKTRKTNDGEQKMEANGERERARERHQHFYSKKIIWKLGVSTQAQNLREKNRKLNA